MTKIGLPLAGLLLIVAASQTSAQALPVAVVPTEFADLLPLSELIEAGQDRATAGVDPLVTYYLSTAWVPAEQRAGLVTAMRFIVPSLSLEQVVDDQVPQQTAADSTLWRIDTKALGWYQSLPRVLQRANPYHDGHGPSLVIRADWFLVAATDCKDSTTYYELVFGEAFTKKAQFLQRLGIVTDQSGLSFGLIEANSGVIVSKKRWIETFGQRRGYAWGTRDSAKIDLETDPLGRPDGKFKHDAEEWIIGVPKIHAATGRRGALQVYFLANAAGDRQDVAPPDIATDHTRVRHGATEIRNGISCISCHVEGMIEPTTNEFRDLITAGADVYADKVTQRSLEAFHLGDIMTEIERNREDFAAMVEACAGVPPKQAVEAFTQVVRAYDAPVTPEMAAAELGVELDELRSAIAYGSNTGQFSPRMVALAHDRAIPRQAWEALYLEAFRAVKTWRAKP
jgi:hypothetical protein